MERTRGGRQWGNGWAPGTFQGPEGQGAAPRIVRKIFISVVFEKLVVRKIAFCSSQGWPKKGLRQAFGFQEASQESYDFLGSALATFKGHLGKVDHAHGSPLWGVMDQHNCVEASLLIVKQC